MDRSRKNENMFIVNRHIPMNRACRVRSSSVTQGGLKLHQRAEIKGFRGQGC